MRRAEKDSPVASDRRSCLFPSRDVKVIEFKSSTIVQYCARMHEPNDVRISRVPARSLIASRTDVKLPVLRRTDFGLFVLPGFFMARGELPSRILYSRSLRYYCRSGFASTVLRYCHITSPMATRGDRKNIFRRGRVLARSLARAFIRDTGAINLERCRFRRTYLFTLTVYSGCRA